MPGQREADVLVDHVDHRRLQLVGVDVLRVGPTQRLRRRDLGGVPGSLIGTEIAAVTEHGENIALDGLCELRIGAGWWSEVAGVASPMLSMLENIKEMPLRHPRTDFLLEFHQPFGLDACRQLLQVWRSVFIDAQFAVGGKSRVDLGSKASSIRPSRRRQNPRRAREYREQHSRPPAVFRIPTKAGVGRDSRQIPPRRRHRDHRSAMPQQDRRRRRPQAHVGQNGRLRPALGDKPLPALRRKAEIDLVRQLFAARMAVPAHDGHCVQQAAILRRRLDVQQIDKPEQQAAVSGVNWPEQREIVAAVPGGDSFALLGQGLDATLLRQEFSYLTPERVVSLLGLCRLQHLAENADQRFLDSTVLIMQRLQLLLGRGLSPPDAAQHHLDQFVATAHACLTQKSKQQCVPLAWLGDVEKFAHLQRRGLSGELAEFGVGNTFQQRVGINQAGQPIKPFDPEPDCRRGRRAGRLLQAIEAGRRAVCRLDQQGVQYRQLFWPSRAPAHDCRSAHGLPRAAD